MSKFLIVIVPRLNMRRNMTPRTLSLVSDPNIPFSPAIYESVWPSKRDPYLKWLLYTLKLSHHLWKALLQERYRSTIASALHLDY